MTNSGLNAQINLKDVIGSFSPYSNIKHALMLTYGFDGPYIEDQEQGLLQLIWQRDCANVIVIRDCKAINSGKRSHRYSVINASYSTRIFHPKLLLLLSKSEALALIGSANLTKGGLAKNLELSCEYRLTHDEGPHHIFKALHMYLRDYLRQELNEASSQERDAFDNLVSDLDHFLEDSRSAQNSSERSLSFIHNYDKPIFDKILEILPGKDLDSLWIVSPFFESDENRKSDDPENDRLDDALIARIFRAFRFTGNQQHHMRIYFQSSSSNITALPLNLLKSFRNEIALYKKDLTAMDQRTLHAKMFVFFGQRPTGERFITIVHGSANFTSAALLSNPPHGNAEIAIATQLPAANVVADNLADYLNLNQLFSRIDNWDSLIQRSSPPPNIMPIVQVWEGMIFLEKMIVQVYFRVNSSNVRRIRVTLCGDKEELHLGDLDFSPGSKEYLEFHLPYGAMKTIDPLGDLRQLPFNYVRLEVFDSNHNSLGRGEGALNVDHPELFIANYLCRIEELRLDNQIYSACGGINRSSIYSIMNRSIDRTLLNKSIDITRIHPTHQADLDLFFRRIHNGLRGLRWQIEQSKGSLYELGSVYRMLATWGTKAAQEDEELTREMRLYLSDRIVHTALEITEMAIQVRNYDKKHTPILRKEFLTRAEPMRDFAACLLNDEDVRKAAENLLKRWNVLETLAEGKKDD